MGLDTARLLLDSGQIRINKFIDENILDWATTEVLQPTKQLSFSEGLSAFAIQGMYIEKVGFMKVQTVWEYIGPHDVPLHLFLEKGTKPHDIDALGKIYGGADFLRWWDKGGKPIFRRHVKHPGYFGRKYMERGAIIGRPRLKSRITREVNSWLGMNRSGR